MHVSPETYHFERNNFEDLLALTTVFQENKALSDALELCLLRVTLHRPGFFFKKKHHLAKIKVFSKKWKVNILP